MVHLGSPSRRILQPDVSLDPICCLAMARGSRALGEARCDHPSSPDDYPRQARSGCGADDQQRHYRIVSAVEPRAAASIGYGALDAASTRTPEVCRALMGSKGARRVLTGSRSATSSAARADTIRRTDSRRKASSSSSHGSRVGVARCASARKNRPYADARAGRGFAIRWLSVPRATPSHPSASNRLPRRRLTCGGQRCSPRRRPSDSRSMVRSLCARTPLSALPPRYWTLWCSSPCGSRCDGVRAADAMLTCGLGSGLACSSVWAGRALPACYPARCDCSSSRSSASRTEVRASRHDSARRAAPRRRVVSTSDNPPSARRARYSERRWRYFLDR